MKFATFLRFSSKYYLFHCVKVDNYRLKSNPQSSSNIRSKPQNNIAQKINGTNLREET